MCRKCQVDNCSCNSVISKSGEKGDRGPQGFSAYQIALANGFIGSEVEWLASLAGGTFLALSDTPNTYEGQAGRVPTVNEDEDGLVFTVLPVELTVDELAAINGANDPSALNVFATIGDIPDVENIYNSNGVLTGNRTVTNNGFTLSFNGTTQIISPEASSLNRAFSIKAFGGLTDLTYIDGAGGFYHDNQIALNGSLSTGAMLFVKQKVSVGGITAWLQDSTGATSFQVFDQQVYVSNSKVRFLRSGQNYFDIMEDDLIVRTDVSGVPKQSMIFKNSGIWNAPVMPIGNVGRAAGDIYMDTAANALANGDLVLIQKQ